MKPDPEAIIFNVAFDGIICGQSQTSWNENLSQPETTTTQNTNITNSFLFLDVLLLIFSLMHYFSVLFPPLFILWYTVYVMYFCIHVHNSTSVPRKFVHRIRIYNRAVGSLYRKVIFYCNKMHGNLIALAKTMATSASHCRLA